MQAEQVDVHYASKSENGQHSKKRSAHPFALPKSSSNRALKSSNAESNLSPYTCPLSILNASHSRMNCSRSFTRAIDSSGSLEPRARARYEATMVDSPPTYANQTHICGFFIQNKIERTQDRSRNRRLSAYMRSKSVQRPAITKGRKEEHLSPTRHSRQPRRQRPQKDLQPNRRVEGVPRHLRIERTLVSLRNGGYECRVQSFTNGFLSKGLL